MQEEAELLVRDRLNLPRTVPGFLWWVLHGLSKDPHGLVDAICEQAVYYFPGQKPSAKHSTPFWA